MQCGMRRAQWLKIVMEYGELMFCWVVGTGLMEKFHMRMSRTMTEQNIFAYFFSILYRCF